MDVKLKVNDGDINHPAYYNTGEYEAISVIEDWELGFHLGNAIKYIARAGRKNRDEYVKDLEKAVWYINRLIKITNDVTVIS